MPKNDWQFLFIPPWFVASILVLLLAACGSVSQQEASWEPPISSVERSQQAIDHGNEISIYAVGLIGTGYRFGGKNPEAGLDCSGMVSYIFNRAANMKLTGSAADIARKGRRINRANLYPGDLVFFNTQHKPFSHVGIYIGGGRFIHAPSTNGSVRIARLDNPYFAKRFEMARAYFN